MTATHQHHHSRPIDCTSNNTAATRRKNGHHQPSKSIYPSLRRQRPHPPPSATAKNYCPLHHRRRHPINDTTPVPLTDHPTTHQQQREKTANNSHQNGISPSLRHQRTHPPLISHQLPRPKDTILCIHHSPNRGIVLSPSHLLQTQPATPPISAEPLQPLNQLRENKN